MSQPQPRSGNLTVLSARYRKLFLAFRQNYIYYVEMNKTTTSPLILIMSIFVLLLIFAGCNPSEHRELTEVEILELLSDVVAGTEVIQEAGLRYFQELSNENNNIIIPSDLQERLSRNEQIFLLDIRRAEDYQRGHIEGARHIWWFDVGRHLDELPRDRRVLVTCYTGQAAGQIVGVLKMLGFEAVSLAGGMNNGWIAAGLPLATQ